MKDQDEMKSDMAGEIGPDMMLARAIRDLDQEISPGRDLWSGIERKITDHPHELNEKGRMNWMPYGIAASLVVAIISLTVSIGGVSGGGAGNADIVSAETSFNQMSNEHIKVFNPLVTRFGQVNENLAPETLDDIYRSLEIMEVARRDIEAQVRKNPDDHRLVEMLMSIHEQELELLRQDFSASGRY
ncbi:MAG: hypothetical protein ACJAVI_002279 [Candidatus Azotimanducaceae bacterium]|jgi:hypothetical protein